MATVVPGPVAPTHVVVTDKGGRYLIVFPGKLPFPRSVHIKVFFSNGHSAVVDAEFNGDGEAKAGIAFAISDTCHTIMYTLHATNSTTETHHFVNLRAEEPRKTTTRLIRNSILAWKTQNQVD